MLSTGQTGHHMKYSVILLSSTNAPNIIIMFGAFVDGWHSVSDDQVFSHNEKYITDWICR
jgi:hypothetical protein